MNQKRTQPQPPNLGKLPPQAIDFEKAVLGAIMLSKEAIEQVSDILTYESFYDEKNAIIFNAITQLYEKGQKIDMLTVAQQLRKNEELQLCGGAFYISELTNNVASDAHIVEHALVIKHAYVKRQLIQIGSSLIESSYQEFNDADELLQEYQVKLSELELGNVSSTIQAANQFVPETMKGIIEKAESYAKGKVIAGIPTFSDSINRATGGFIKETTSCIAGRPGEGKTAMLLECAMKALIDGYKVGIISLEMSTKALVERVFSNLCQINGYHIRDGNLSIEDFEKLNAQAERLVKENLFITDSPFIGESKLRSTCRQFVKKYGVDIVFIDYFQLIMPTSKGNGKSDLEVQNNQRISILMKNIAKEFKIAFVYLSQASRNGNARPTNENLRGGGLEQATDLIIWTYDEDYQTNKTAAIVQQLLLVTKAKNGSTGDHAIEYNKTYQRMRDIQGYPQTYTPTIGNFEKTDDAF